MTGSQIRDIRHALGLEPTPFAQLLGIHPSTLYRWEAAGDAVVRVEPLQLQLLTVLAQKVTSRPAPEASGVGEAILTGLLVGGGLFGLFKLLEAVFDDDGRTGGARTRAKSARATSSSQRRRRRP